MQETLSTIKKEYKEGDIGFISAIRALNDIGHSIEASKAIVSGWKKTPVSDYLTRKASDKRIAAMRQRIANEVRTSHPSNVPDFWKIPLSERLVVLQLAFARS
jgi:DNA-binding transcriptional MerR regulator